MVVDLSLVLIKYLLLAYIPDEHNPRSCTRIILLYEKTSMKAKISASLVEIRSMIQTVKVALHFITSVFLNHEIS